MCESRHCKFVSVIQRELDTDERSVACTSAKQGDKWRASKNISVFFRARMHILTKHPFVRRWSSRVATHKSQQRWWSYALLSSKKPCRCRAEGCSVTEPNYPFCMKKSERSSSAALQYRDNHEALSLSLSWI